MTSGRIAVFLLTVLTVWSFMHLYTFWRLAKLPWLATVPRWAWWAAGLLLWFSYPFARYLDRNGMSSEFARLLELSGAVWLGTLFLLVTALLASELLTAFGLWKAAVVPVRTGSLALAALLSVVGIVQGNRTPRVESLEVQLPQLPRELDGLRVVQLSDLHLGTILREGWLSARLAQVQALKPDLVVVTGDLIDGNARHVERLLPLLKELKAPLGVYAVTGNHEFYAGLEASVQLFRDAGFTVLRDQNVEVRPGLVMAGVDDLTARRQYGINHRAVEKALAGRPPGACVFLSHTPWQVEEAARLGAGLMLSGHTHDGQIWPFSYLVRLSYPYVGGTYQVNGLTLHVSRGTGTWGPRLRLWKPGEITLITLRSPSN
ncbi:MAG: metallophosphoesterase [Acidobacteriota bacterium]